MYGVVVVVRSSTTTGVALGCPSGVIRVCVDAEVPLVVCVDPAMVSMPVIDGSRDMGAGRRAASGWPLYTSNGPLKSKRRSRSNCMYA